MLFSPFLKSFLQFTFFLISSLFCTWQCLFRFTHVFILFFIPSFFWDHFPSFWSKLHPLEVLLEWVCSSKLPILGEFVCKHIFFYPSFLKVSFARDTILGWQLFCLCSLKIFSPRPGFHFWLRGRLSVCCCYTFVSNLTSFFRFATMCLVVDLFLFNLTWYACVLFIFFSVCSRNFEPLSLYSYFSSFCSLLLFFFVVVVVLLPEASSGGQGVYTFPDRRWTALRM